MSHLLIAAAMLLTGKMAAYNDLLGDPWKCTLGTVTYSAQYTAGPGNTIHAHLYSNDSSEDQYWGYDARRNVYWLAGADFAGETESQTSTDGWTFVGTLAQGDSTSKTTNVYTLGSAHKWGVHATGSAGGQPYDVTAACVR